MIFLKQDSVIPTFCSVFWQLKLIDPMESLRNMAMLKQQFQLGYDESDFYADNDKNEMYSTVVGFSIDQENLNDSKLENDYR